MKTIQVTDAQEYFIKCALSLKEHVLDFEDEDFEGLTGGYTQEEMKEELKDLMENLI